MSALLVLSGTTNANSLPMYWKGGYGTMTFVGTGDASAALHYQPATTAPPAPGTAASYVAHGAEVDASTPINHFHCAEGYIYVAVTERTTGSWAIHLTRDEYTAPSDGLSHDSAYSAVA